MLAGLVLGGANASYAEQNDKIAATPPLFPKQIVLDGKSYDDEDLSIAFKRIAFSSYIGPAGYPDEAPAPPFWTCDLPSQRLMTEACGTPVQYKTYYPWLYEYIYREHGVPRFYAINKWTGPIRISLGYPNDLMPAQDGHWQQDSTFSSNLKSMNPHNVNGTLAAGCPEEVLQTTQLCLSDYEALTGDPRTSNEQFISAMKTVSDEVKGVMPVLRELTGLDVSFIPHEQETSDRFANLRIVLFRLPSSVQRLKTGIALPSEDARRSSHVILEGSIYSVAYHLLIEPLLTTAVRFTPYTNQQVEGYFLPNTDNSIGMSFCFIPADSPPPLLKALVRECLIRSLGLPNAFKTTSEATLGLWSPHLDTASLRHGPSTDRNFLMHQEMEWKPEELSRLPPITEFDSFMVKTLYNPAIKPGMSVNEFYRAAAPQQYELK